VEKLWDMINYLCGVTIVDHDDVLYIEDRRPTWTMVLSFGGLVAVVAIAAWTWFTIGLKLDVFTVGLPMAAFAVAAYFCITGNYREMYVFNKKTDSFTFTRQSMMNSDVLEGSASQFRAVQVERRASDDSEIYMVALLCQGLLLGQSDTQILRENPPLLNSRETESRIASAIARFLGVPREGVVDVL
jgi:hypothetical protein